MEPESHIYSSNPVDLEWNITSVTKTRVTVPPSTAPDSNVLAQYSTRELLNECYRRKAIVNFTGPEITDDEQKYIETLGSSEKDNWWLTTHSVFLRSLAHKPFIAEKAIRTEANGPKDILSIYVCAHPNTFTRE